MLPRIRSSDRYFLTRSTSQLNPQVFSFGVWCFLQLVLTHTAVFLSGGLPGITERWWQGADYSYPLQLSYPGWEGNGTSHVWAQAQSLAACRVPYVGTRVYGWQDEDPGWPEPGWPSACPGIRHFSSCSWAPFLTSYSLTRGIWAQGGISRAERCCMRTGSLSNFSGVFGDCLCCQLSHESSKSILVTSGEQTCNFFQRFQKLNG